jgi:hypothetical protein
MRIDPKSTIGGFSALVVRKMLRNLRIWDQWNVTDLEKAAALAQGPVANWSRLCKQKD